MTRRPDRDSPLHRKLMSLGEHQAPPVIFTAVMSHVHARRRAAAGQAWWRWPQAARWAYMASWVCAAALLAWMGQGALSLSGPLDRLAPLGRAALVVFGSLRAPLLAALFFSYLTCAGLGSAFFRLAARTRD